MQIMIFILILLSAIYSAAETAFTSLSFLQIEEVSKKSKIGYVVEKLSRNSSKLISTILIGNNIANLTASALVTEYTIEKFGNSFIALSTGITTLIILLFAEIVPKQIAIANNIKIAKFLAIFLYINVILFTPIVFLINNFTNLVLKLFLTKREDTLTLENLRSFVKIASKNGILAKEEHDIIKKILFLNEIRANEIMTHRKEVFMLSGSEKLKDALEKIKEQGFSRVPVYKKDNKEEIIGILILKDYLAPLKEILDKKIEKLIAPAIFVQGNKKIKNIFPILKESKNVMAIVLDEFGGFNGIITIEDLIEKFFGEIFDEKDEDANFIEKIAHNTYQILPETSFDTLEEQIGITLERNQDVNTIGGFIMQKLDKIPSKGDKVELKNAVFEVEKASKTKILSIKLTLF